MSLTSIVIILQLALSLLASVQSNPNLPNDIRQQAIDFSYQAIEMATDGIATLANPTANEAGLGSNEVSKPCVLNPDKICKYPIAPTSTPQWVNPPQNEYPQYHFTFNSVEISNRSRQFINLNENFTISWNVSQKNNNHLICEGNSDNNETFNSPSNSITRKMDKKSYNFNLNCKDNILGVGNSFTFQIISN